MTDLLSLLILKAQEKTILSEKNTTFDNLPPTRVALKYHIHRAVYQASIVWGQSLINIHSYHSQEQWGQKKILMAALILFDKFYCKVLF